MIKTDKLKKYHHIFVTGCQRSGTRFVSEIIAQDTGKIYTDERDYNVHDLDRLNELLNDGKDRIIHCPALSIYLDFMAFRDIITSNDCVVWVKRNREDVYKSMKRIKWTGAITEDAKYFCYFNDISDIWEKKNKYWNYQRQHLQNLNIGVLDVQYESLKKHPLWLDPKDRI